MQRPLGRDEHSLLEAQTELLMGVQCIVIREATRAHLIVTALATQLAGVMMDLQAADRAPCCTGDCSYHLLQAGMGWLGEGPCNRL